MNEAQLADDVFGGAALVPHDLIAGLVAEYGAARVLLKRTASYMQGDPQGVLRFFIDGNVDRDRHGPPDLKRLFDEAGAVAALNSHFWERTIQLTDVLNAMPQARRTEWYEQIRTHKCPAFDEQIVRDTMAGLLSMRAQFLAERVDGIFRGLSGEHVTNQPQGFSKRMIIANVLTAYGTTEYRQCGLINDLRAVIAKFMHRDEPSYQASETLVRALRGSWGEWTDVDGGALRVRLYRKGTAHLEVHPDIAWRLNGVLAHLYPRAIPPQFRERPARTARNVTLIQRPLPFAVTAALAAVSPAYSWNHEIHPATRTVITNCVVLPSGLNKHVKDEAENVLIALGATQTAQGWQFDYSPLPLITTVAVSGVIPDERSHQFYPTPPEVAARAVSMANIQPNHTCLEPSAGVGNLAALMPQQTVCVEVAKLRCDVLTARGHIVEQADFLAWAAAARLAGRLFDRVVMNPPFDSGRWQAHLEAASRLVRPGGRLVAILPSGAANSARLDTPSDWAVTFPVKYDNAFTGASVSVVIMVAERSK